MTVRLEAGASTVHWGYLDATLPAVAAVDSGDVVTISTVSGPPEALPPPPANVPQALHDIHNSKARRMLPGHMCTGPVAVRGARPGQVLQVDIEDIALHYDWGYTGIRPLKGALPYDFPEPQMIHVALERNRMVGRLPWGTEIPLRPFFGVMANAPPRAWGTVSSIQPRQFGGNMDNKELVAGTTLYLPVFVENALFSVGDGHAAQGDGEVCVNAIETGLIGRFRLTLRDDMSLDLADGGNADPRHHHGLRPRPRRLRRRRVAPNARSHREPHHAQAPRGLHAREPRRRPARHPSGQRLQGHPRDAGEAVPAAGKVIVPVIPGRASARTRNPALSVPILDSGFGAFAPRGAPE